MQIKIARPQLMNGIRMARSIAERKGAMPILSNIVLRTNGQDGLMIAATDLSVSVVTQIKSTTIVDGGITLDAAKFDALISGAAGPDVSLKKTENNWTEVKIGRSSYKMAGLPDTDFPKIPDHTGHQYVYFDTSLLDEMIDRTLFSISTDESRFNLAGIFLESDGEGNVSMTSTDGHRVSKAERKMPNFPKLETGVIIPKKGLLALKRMLQRSQQAQIAIVPPHLFVVHEDTALSVKLIDGQFLAYHQIMEVPTKSVISVNRLELSSAIRRAELMTTETRGISISVVKNAITITSANPNIGEAREEVEASYDGDPVAIGFNPDYISELLNQMISEKVIISLDGALSPGHFRPDSDDVYVGVVLPMRI